MMKNYQQISSKKSISSVLQKILYFVVFIMLSGAVSAQCNSDTPIPFINTTFGNLSATGTTSGPISCAGCSASSPANLIDADLTDFAIASIPLGLGGNVNFRVTDADTDYAAGTYAGYRIDAGGTLNVNLLNSVTISTYLNGTLRETNSGSSLQGTGLLSSSGNSYVVGFNTTKDFDAIEIKVGGLSVLNTINVYYPVIRNYCVGPALNCNTVTAMNLPTYPVGIEPSHSGMSGVSVGNVTDEDNVISSSTTDYASISFTANVAGSASISVKDQITNYPAGTYAGFDIENTGSVNLSALGNLTVTTYLDGVQQQQFSGNNLLVKGTLLNGAGRYNLGFVSTASFDEVRLSVNQTLSVNLGTTKVYSAVFEKFCAGPALVCNTQTPMLAPTYPVFINGTNTGIDGLVCALCSVNNADNLIDQDTSNYAQINLTAAVGNSGSISVKDQFTDYPAGTYAGFTVENPSLLNANALDAITIRTYLDGVLQETKSGNSALIAVGTNLLVGSSPQTIGFISTKDFDEVRITLTNTATVSLSTVNVYSAVFEKLCPVTLECNKSYALTNPTFPVIIDSAKTGVNGVACVSCAVNNTNNVLTADTNDFATISVTAGVTGSASIAVLDQLSTYPVGTFAGFTIKDVNNLIQLDLFNSLTVSTYLDGQLKESKAGSQLLGLSLGSTQILGPAGQPGLYNVGFNASQSFDEIRITVNSTVGVINNIRVYGAFVNTAGTSGGTLNCAVIDAVNDVLSPIIGSVGNTNAGNVLTNDTLNSSPVAISNINLTVTTLATPASVGAPVPSIDVATGIVSVPAGTPAGTYVITYQICYKLNSLTCDSATVTIPVSAAAIDAVDDPLSPINGLTGNSNAGNALANDKLNGSPVAINDINLTVTTPATPVTVGAPVPSMDMATGIISIPAGTPAGSYTIVYKICEKINPANCDTATITIPVSAAAINAVDDSLSSTGVAGNPNVSNVLTNDTLNGSPVAISDINLTVITPAAPASSGAPVPSIDVATGVVSVPPSTPAGNYTITYKICEKLNPSNCDSATVTVPVSSSSIDAVADVVSVDGLTGNADAGNVLTNDKLNGSVVVIGDVDMTVTTPATPASSGAPVPSVDPATGIISIPAATPAGTYTIIYQICEKNINPLNCDSATVTVTVSAAQIDAVADGISGINGLTGSTNAGNVLTNDSFNHVSPVAISDVNMTVPIPATPVTAGAPVPSIDVTTGIVSIPTGTPAGIYNITYQICEKLNPSNCDSATLKVTVDAAAIDAVADDISGINGLTGSTNAGNVLANDKLNGSAVAIGAVNMTVLTPATPAAVGAPVPSIDVATGIVSVPTGTPAGTYFITYQICEKLNPSNCDSATVKVTVDAAAIDAVADDISGVNGFTGSANAGNVLTNDSFNHVSPVSIGAVNMTIPTPATPVTVGAPVPSIDVTTGIVSIPAGTPAGIYNITYQICEKLNPSNCDSAILEVTVDAAVIDAVADDISGVNGFAGSTNAGNVLTNDKLNGSTVTIGAVNMTVPTPATPVTVGAPVPSIDVTTGIVSIPAGTPAGIYNITYQICEKLNPSNCDSAIVKVTVDAAAINAVDDNLSSTGVAGNPNVSNVLTNDTLNGSSVSIDQINLTVTTPATPATVGAPVPSIDIATGIVSVPPSTPAGNYTIIYKICEKLNPSNCDSAIVTVPVSTSTIDAVADVIPSTNGLTGNANAGNVLTNDTLNGSPVAIGQINLTVSTPAIPATVGAPVPSIDVTTGIVSIPAATPAGTYTITYQICEKLNPSNCDSATVTIPVKAAVIDAVADTNTGTVYGTGGSTGINVFANDTLNGTLLNPSDVILTSTPNGPLKVNADGSVTLAPNTPGGTYTVDYTICEKLNPSNCDTTTVTVFVSVPKIALVKIGAINGPVKAGSTITYTFTVTNTGNTTLTGVVVNDALTGSANLAVTPSTLLPNQTGTATASYTIKQSDIDTHKVTNSATVKAKDPNNNDVTDISGSTNLLDDPTVTLLSSIALVKTGVVNGAVKAGNTITYTFTVTNTGNTNLTAVMVNDALTNSVNLVVAPSTLLPNQTGTATATYTITQSDIDAGKVTNSATVNAKDPNNNDVTDISGSTNLLDDPTVTVLVPNSSIKMVKKGVAVAKGKVGTDMKYTFTVTNTGNTTLTGVVVNDAMTNSVNLAVTPSVLLPNQVGTATANYTIQQSDIDAGKIINTATVTGKDPGNNDVSYTASTTNLFLTINPLIVPNIALVKVGTINGSGKAGDTITYTFTVTNNGGMTLTGAVINDPLTNSVNLVVTPSTLAPNATGTAMAIYTITQADVDAGKVINTATVKAKDPSNNDVTDISGTTISTNDPTVTIITSNPAIALVKVGTVNGAGKLGDTITYTFTVTNTGNTTLTGAVINDALTNTVGLAVTPVILLPYATGTATVTYTITQADLDAGKVTNTATVTAKDPFNNDVTDISGTTNQTDDATVNILTQNKSIAITKDGTYVDANNDGIANAGDVVNYTFSVTNTGDVDLTDIVVTDPKVAIIGGPLATLAVGATDSTTFTATYTITAADVEAGYVYNLATATATVPGGTPVTAISTDPTPCTNCPADPACPTCTITVIPQSPAIAVVKTAVFNDNNGDGSAQVGETITYSFLVTNTGNTPLTNVWISDPLPGVVMSGGPITLAVGASDSTTFVATYTITKEDMIAGKVSNQATVYGTSPAGVDVSDLSDYYSAVRNEATVLGLLDCVLNVYNAVSPDDDGRNDYFRISGIECYPKNTVEIYNRWGIKVFEKHGYINDTNLGFNGKSQGRATVGESDGLPSGTYFYTIKYEDTDGNKLDRSGYLMLSKD